jgi:Rieske [2Fe-2S] domain
MIQRSDRLKEPPVVGKWYMVPAILWNRNHGKWDTGDMSEADLIADLRNSNGAKWWPVWGIKHDDVEYFNFRHLHYHIDPRFLTKRHAAELVGFGSRAVLQCAQAQPINHLHLRSGPPRPTLRRMRCTLDHSKWGFSDSSIVVEMNKSFAGKQCGSGKRGFVCPHKHFPLGSVKAINGVVTCPLHGLRIDAETGKCLG